MSWHTVWPDSAVTLSAANTSVELRDLLVAERDPVGETHGHTLSERADERCHEAPLVTPPFQAVPKNDDLLPGNDDLLSGQSEQHGEEYQTPCPPGPAHRMGIC